ncbi:MAG: hypothetical protein AAF637_03845 [Pseudomonadota bacterium]
MVELDRQMAAFVAGVQRWDRETLEERALTARRESSSRPITL